ncbi:MAG: sigma-70 family RNA polymerase sigma factor [Ruminococcaceae bacterium]|nr:sigma-70 family RNA polymerase sigma factor [Oscillospiraceae bacterium]MBD5116786.1 sigma-70 family RNA polymerase sigma factor [Oscillospiraceae bacterium]
MDFEQIYKAYYIQVFSYVMTFSGNPEEAEEVTQKAFFKALLSIEKFRGESSHYTWLCTIAKNIYLDKKRDEQKHRRSVLSEKDTSVNIEEGLEDKDTALRIHRILHQMEEPYKEVFQLRVFGELSFSDIGNLFGKTESWARVTFHRAKIKIKDKLEQ